MFVDGFPIISSYLSPFSKSEQLEDETRLMTRSLSYLSHRDTPLPGRLDYPFASGRTTSDRTSVCRTHFLGSWFGADRVPPSSGRSRASEQGHSDWSRSSTQRDQTEPVIISKGGRRVEVIKLILHVHENTHGILRSPRRFFLFMCVHPFFVFMERRRIRLSQT